jgi:aryl-alcohol dehydrogenase (NADP+)
VCVYNPLAAGLLTGKHDAKKPPAEGGRFTQERLGPMYLERYWSDINFNAIERLKQVAEEHGHNMAQFALAWVLNQPAITAAACGISSAKQLEINAAAVEIALSQEELAACDEVWCQLRPPRFLYGR